MVKKSNLDTLIALVLVLSATVFLVQRRLGYIAIWLVLIVSVLGYGIRMPLAVSAILGIATVIVVVLISGQTLREGYDNPSKSDEPKEEDDPKGHSTTKSKAGQINDEDLDAHIDAGTTILHAFQKLKPEQVLQMREDTKELMETQKQLVDTLASLGPQIKQGADLMHSFQDMFGGNVLDVLKKD
jgi:hypothetical protein